MFNVFYQNRWIFDKLKGKEIKMELIRNSTAKRISVKDHEICGRKDI